MQYHAELCEIHVVAVGIVAIPTDAGEVVHLTGRSNGQRDGIRTAEEVLQSSVVNVGKAPWHVAIEEGTTRAKGVLVRFICVVTLAERAVATGEGSVLEDRVVVATLATTNAAQVHAVLGAELEIGAIRFIAPAVDLVQVDGHEEALHFCRSDRGLA